MYPGERFNSISHLIGAIMAFGGATVLVVVASHQGDPWKIVSFSLYGVSLVSLYTFSTLYHSLRHRAKAVFRRLDHLAIYLLIAGTYTPFALVTLHGGWGWSLLGVIWGLAAIGMALEFLPRRGTRVLPVVIYMAMGWLALIVSGPLWRSLPWEGFYLLIGGGALYSLGVVFYIRGSTLRWAHGIWHLFVLAGSISHFLVIYFYVA